MHLLSKPFPRSYWVVPGMFLAGEYPGHTNPEKAFKKMNALTGAGIRTIINLQEEDETDWNGKPFAPYDTHFFRAATLAQITVHLYRYPIIDNDIPDTKTMIQILNTIDKSITDNQPVYIHCWGGKGRTGTVTGCYLIRHGIAEPDNVFEYLNRLRMYDAHGSEPSPQTHRQFAFVKNWKKNN